eukprot:4599591-Alexandrium_andersonii.AAC.1
MLTATPSAPAQRERRRGYVEAWRTCPAGRLPVGGRHTRLPRSRRASEPCARLSGEPYGPLGGTRARGPAGGWPGLTGGAGEPPRG